VTLADPGALRVYVVTSSAFAGRTHRDVALAAIRGGATAIQLRAPELEEGDLRPLAAELGAICRRAGVLFVVNDRPDVAAAAGADGAHVGQADDPAGARVTLGPGPVLGISVASVEEARRARSFGADYLGVTVWPTSTKPGARAAGLEAVRAVAAATELPVVGIGGINAGNAGAVLGAGAVGVAVLSAVAAAADPVDATRRLVAAVRDAGEVRGAAR
jgi:thiamine-phosphate diphosphorylase